MNILFNNSVLSFLAENVNIYNYYLLRGNNPRYAMYDETGETLQKLYNILIQSVEENNAVSLQLQNAVVALQLSDHSENNITNTYLLCSYIQTRQRDLHNNGYFPEVECELRIETGYSYYINYPPYTGNLYNKLYNLERIYLDILSYDEPELQRTSYNHIFENELPLQELSEPPVYGMNLESLELQIVYLSSHMGYVEEDKDNNYFKIIDTNNINIFNCPICFEDQSVGNICVSTICNHQFCTPCFKSMTQLKRVCAMCRGEINEYIVSIVVE
jgi:hypothetical protein